MQQQAIKLMIWAALLTSALCLDSSPFINLGASAVALPHTNDGASGPIALPSNFPFGTQFASTVYVTTDGYFSVDNLTISPLPHVFSNDSSDDNIIAPFWADADPSQGGNVSYQIFMPENGSEWLNMTGTLIDYREGFTNYAIGEWMLVAEWHQVPQFNSANMATNTFQGILFKVNHTLDAYAVFTYHCGNTNEMQWSGNATIGWKSGDLWRNHPLSGSPNASTIACDNYPSTGEWSNMVYRLTGVDSCSADQFGCATGICVPLSDLCDGQPECPDWSDESGCKSLSHPTPPLPTPTPPCNGTACATMQCIAQNIAVVSGGSFSCRSAMPCHDLVCDVSDGERLDLTILECNQPAAARLVTRDSGGILQFNHTFTQSGIVHITVSGTAVTLNVTIQRKSGMKLGLQIDADISDEGIVTFVPHSEIPLDKSNCSSGPPFVPFIDLGAAAITLPRVSDGASGPIVLPNEFPFGKDYPSTVYVTTDGYFSVGENLTISPLPHLFSNDSSYDNIVAPFWADADPSRAGNVSYQIFTAENGSEWLNMTGTLIEHREGFTTIGEWMLVAEWRQVPQFNSTNMATNTFQGILFKVKHTLDAYAVFTYHCGNTNEMQWSGNATIGWKSGDQWRNHPLSGSPNASTIACDNNPSTGEWSNMVYRLVGVDSCSADQFGCATGICVPLSDLCDGQPECPDGSDESGCKSLPHPTPPPPTPTPPCNGTACATMQCIAQNIAVVSGGSFSCRSAMPCHDLVCDVSNGERLDLTILECNQPAAARLVTRDSGGILQFNHTFTQSGIVHITVSGTAVTLNVTIQHLKGGTKLGLQIDVSIPNEGAVTFVPHSEFPIDTSSCSSDMICNVMENIAEAANLASNNGLTCFTNPPCVEIDCAVDTGEELEFIVLKCNDPPAIQLVLNNKDNILVYNQTFTKSELATIATGGIRRVLNITLHHIDEAIGVQIDVLTPDEKSGYRYQTFVPYTSIPIDTTSCSNNKSLNILTIAVAVPLGVLLVLVILVLVCVLLYKRWKSDQYGFQPMISFNEADEGTE